MEGIVFCNWEILTGVFLLVSLLTRITWFFSRSLGPNSKRIGTPFNSHSWNFQPGEFSVDTRNQDALSYLQGIFDDRDVLAPLDPVPRLGVQLFPAAGQNQRTGPESVLSST